MSKEFEQYIRERANKFPDVAINVFPGDLLQLLSAASPAAPVPIVVTHFWSIVGLSNPPWLHYRLLDGTFASGYADKGELPNKLTSCDDSRCSPLINDVTGESFGEWVPIHKWLDRAAPLPPQADAVDSLVQEINSAVFCLTGDQETMDHVDDECMRINATNAVKVLRAALATLRQEGEGG